MLEIDKSKPDLKLRFWDGIKRILCLIIPILFAFGGYFLAPYCWSLLNHSESAPEYFRFICSLIFFIIPTIIIFIETRKLNPVIKITIKDKESAETLDSENSIK